MSKSLVLGAILSASLAFSPLFTPSVAVAGAGASSLPNPVAVRTTQLTLTLHHGRRQIVVKVYRPVRAEQPCPVILFSHGLGGTQNDCAYLGSAWASSGFVSLHIRHQAISEDCRDGRVRPLQAYRDTYEQHWTGRSVARDVMAVLNWLTRPRDGDEHEPAHLIGVPLDTDRIGVGGYNLGALSSLMLAGQIPPDGGALLTDPRIKAVVSLGAPVYPTRIAPQQLYHSLTLPILFVAGTEDDSVVGQTKGPQRRIPFDLAPSDSAAHYLLTLTGGDHQVYSGKRLFGSDSQDARYHSAMARATTLFWAASLLEDDEAEGLLEAAAQRRGFMAVGRVEVRGGNGLPQVAVSLTRHTPVRDASPHTSP